MGSLGRKLARQNKRQSPEGKEEIKQEQANKQAARPVQNGPLLPQSRTDFQPQVRVRQRRSGNA
jgi:hypothetical protein